MTYLVDISATSSNKNLKELIVNVLMTEYPISLKKLYNVLKKRHSISISYQAVHKALMELVSKGVILKENREYLLNLGWIKDVKQLSKKLEEAYSNKDSFLNSKWDDSSSMQTIVFDSLFDMDKFLLTQASNFLLDEPLSEVPFYSHWNFSWWPLFFSRSEYQVLGKIINPERVYITIKNNSAIAKMCSNFYSGNDFKIKIDVEFENNFDFVIFGDLIIQMYWPKKLKKELEDLFGGSKDIHDIDMNKLVEIFERKEKIQVVILKNKDITDNISKNYLEIFS